MLYRLLKGILTDVFLSSCAWLSKEFTMLVAVLVLFAFYGNAEMNRMHSFVKTEFRNLAPSYKNVSTSSHTSCSFLCSMDSSCKSVSYSTSGHMCFLSLIKLDDIQANSSFDIDFSVYEKGTFDSIVFHFN